MIRRASQLLLADPPVKRSSRNQYLRVLLLPVCQLEISSLKGVRLFDCQRTHADRIYQGFKLDLFITDSTMKSSEQA